MFVACSLVNVDFDGNQERVWVFMDRKTQGKQQNIHESTSV